jgi:hypothetical protein
VTLTSDGEVLLGFARRLLALNRGRFRNLSHRPSLAWCGLVRRMTSANAFYRSFSSALRKPIRV